MRTVQTQRAQVTQRGAAPRWPSPSSCGSPPPPLWAPPPPIHPRSGGGDPDLQSPPCLRGSENGGPSPAPSPLPPEERRWRRKGGGGQAREFTVAVSGSDWGGGVVPPTLGRRRAGVCVSRVSGRPPTLLLPWGPFLSDWDCLLLPTPAAPPPPLPRSLPSSRLAPIQCTPPLGPRSFTGRRSGAGPRGPAGLRSSSSFPLPQPGPLSSSPSACSSR